jgi:FAD binding domain
MTNRPMARFAEEVGSAGPVAVEGRRTRWQAGGPPADGTVVVRAPSGVVDHRPEEMTVTVLAGTTVSALEAALVTAEQRSALPDRGGTVGGAVAVGENHIDVTLRGGVAASVLRVRYVAADGRLVTGGAPTVKNVSGFDLPRLMVGALGTLGLLAELTLRTNPIPPLSLWLEGETNDPFGVIASAPGRATVLWDGRRTWLHLEGHPVDLHQRRRALPGRWHDRDGPPRLPPHRWSLRPSELRHLPDLVPGPYVASVGVGLVFAEERQPARPVDEGARRLAARAKALFDPPGRLNPGRDPARR